MGTTGIGHPVNLDTETASDAARTSGSLPFDQPWVWLAAGWRDLWNKPGISLAYGVTATVIGAAIAIGLVLAGLEALIPVLAGGFILVGPVAAVGLYEKSRRLAAGQPVSIENTVDAVIRAAPRLGLFAASLLLVYFIWVRIAFLLLMLFLGTNALPPARDFVQTLLFTPHGLGLLITGTAVGALLAAAVFAISAISIPMLVDRDVDAFTAMGASIEAVVKNPRPMLLWAALIAGFMALGLATLGAGLVFAFPLIGHATWHAYTDVKGR
mgnify:CR=1 FL=1